MGDVFYDPQTKLYSVNLPNPRSRTQCSNCNRKCRHIQLWRYVVYVGWITKSLVVLTDIIRCGIQYQVPLCLEDYWITSIVFCLSSLGQWWWFYWEWLPFIVCYYLSSAAMHCATGKCACVCVCVCMCSVCVSCTKLDHVRLSFLISQHGKIVLFLPVKNCTFWPPLSKHLWFSSIIQISELHWGAFNCFNWTYPCWENALIEQSLLIVQR